jgi:hypothetical protein
MSDARRGCRRITKGTNLWSGIRRRRAILQGAGAHLTQTCAIMPPSVKLELPYCGRFARAVSCAVLRILSGRWFWSEGESEDELAGCCVEHGD